MATLNGVDLFGPVCTVSTSATPRRQQINRYCGVNGKQRKDLGGDGGFSTVEGWLIADTTDDLGTLESDLRAYLEDPGTYTFVDNYGNEFIETKLQMSQVADRVYPATAALVGGQGFARRYQVTLEHMI